MFDEHLRAGECDAAESALAHLRQNVGGDLVTAREVQLRARQGKQDESLALLKQLCHSHDPAAWSLDAAAGAITAAGWTVPLKQAFRTAISEGDWHPQVALLWAERFDFCQDRDLDDCLAALDKAQCATPIIRRSTSRRSC